MIEDGRVTRTNIEHGNHKMVHADRDHHRGRLYPSGDRVCESCGFRMRGPNHEQGDHHNNRSIRHSSKK